MAVVKDGQVVLERGWGVRELGKPGQVDAHTLFAIASNTKAFTAASLAMLADEGRPVPYTHLDVYKRQEQGPGQAAPQGATEAAWLSSP